jgi:ESCRT-I complex subunit TSG101
MDGAVKRLEEWLDAAEKHQQQEDENGKNDSSSQLSKVDLIALPTDTHSSQMLQLAAENAAIDDCIYFLDQSMARGNIPLDVFLKEVRKLSKRQFMVKAHLIKISQVKALS